MDFLLVPYRIGTAEYVTSSKTHDKDESFTINLCSKENENESCTSFDEMLNESLKMNRTIETLENSMEIIDPDLPQMNAKDLTVAPNCTTDDEDTLASISRYTR